MRDELPNGWTSTKLSNCIEILDSKRIPINNREREKRISGKSKKQLYPYFGATGQVGWIDDFIFNDEILLLGEDGAPFLDAIKNKAYIVKGKSWVNNHAHVLRSLSGITTNKFLCNYLNFFDYHEFVTGTTRLKLNQSRMKEIPVLVPPYGEQNKIVLKIEELFTKLDAGIDSLKQTQLLLKKYRQSVLKSAVEGKLTSEWRKENKDELETADKLLDGILKERKEKWEADQLANFNSKGKKPPKNWQNKYKEPSPPDTSELPELPVGWVWVTFDYIGELNRGKSKHRPRNDPKLYGGEYPFVQTGDIRKSNKFIRDYSQTYNETGLKQSRLWPKGTLCITIAANIADTAILDFDACFPDSVVGFLPNSSINVFYIEYFLRTAKENLDRYAPSTAQKNINLTILNQLAIPLPPKTEQDMIVDEVDRIISIADDTNMQMNKEFKRSEYLRQSILKHAFQGKLVPQDPNDEPATRLLEKIKAEKAKLKN